MAPAPAYIHINLLFPLPTAGCCQCVRTASHSVVPGPVQWQSLPCWKVEALDWTRRGETRELSWLSLLPDPEIPPLSWSESGWGGEMVLEGEEKWRRSRQRLIECREGKGQSLLYNWYGTEKEIHRGKKREKGIFWVCMNECISTGKKCIYSLIKAEKHY